MAMADKHRWVFFVTPKELFALLDEAEKHADFKSTMTPEITAGLRSMRGLWNLNGVSIMPELREPDERMGG
jgi:hypothetical protein